MSFTSLFDLKARKRFASRDWPYHFFVGQTDLQKLKTYLNFDELKDLSSYSKKHRGDIKTYIPSGNENIPREFNGRHIKPKFAETFLAAGATLYYTTVEKTLADLKERCLEIEKEFNFPTGSTRMELFVSGAKSGAPLHCDHELNISVQLIGRKKWTFRENRTLVYPAQPSRPSLGPNKGEMKLYEKPLVAKSPAPLKTFIVEPGTVVIVPHGSWHETVALEDSLAVTIAVLTPSWMELALKLVWSIVKKQDLWLEPANDRVSSSKKKVITSLLSELPLWQSQLTLKALLRPTFLKFRERDYERGTLPPKTWLDLLLIAVRRRLIVQEPWRKRIYSLSFSEAAELEATQTLESWASLTQGITLSELLLYT